MGERQPFHRTRDGLPISPDPPHGAAVVVYRCNGPVVEYLILHRAHRGPGYEGDWAWGPPSGARLPGEPVDRCARRELEEDTGLRLPVRRVGGTAGSWALYAAEAPAGAAVRLSVEHDRWAWVGRDEAVRRCLPAVVGRQILTVARLVEAGE